MTRMRAPFSSFSLWLSDFSSVKICRETKTRWDQRGSEGQRGHCIPSTRHTSMALQHLQSFHKLAARHEG